jgi:hypothetical protein
LRTLTIEGTVPVSAYVVLAEKVTEILVGESEGKKSLGTLRHRWGNNIKIGVKGIPVG